MTLKTVNRNNLNIHLNGNFRFRRGKNMKTSEFDQEFVEELEKRIEIIRQTDTPDKRLRRIDYILVWVFSILSILLLIFGRSL